MSIFMFRYAEYYQLVFILLKGLFIFRPYLHEDHVDVERCAHVDQLEYTKTVAHRRGACRKTFSQW